MGALFVIDRLPADALDQRRAAEDTALRLRDDFVWSLAAGYIASAADATARGRLLGYDLSRRYAGLYGKVERGDSDGENRGLPAHCRQRIRGGSRPRS